MPIVLLSSPLLSSSPLLLSPLLFSFCCSLYRCLPLVRSQLLARRLAADLPVMLPPALCIIRDSQSPKPPDELALASMLAKTTQRIQQQPSQGQRQTGAHRSNTSSPQNNQQDQKQKKQKQKLKQKQKQKHASAPRQQSHSASVVSRSLRRKLVPQNLSLCAKRIIPPRNASELLTKAPRLIHQSYLVLTRASV